MLNLIKKMSLVLIITMFSCKSKDVSKTNNESVINFNNKEITQEFYNQDQSLILQTTYLQDTNPQKSINYKVLSAKTKKVVKEGTFTGLKLEWFGNSQLKGYLFRGMVEKENDNPLLEDNTNKNKNYTIIDLK